MWLQTQTNEKSVTIIDLLVQLLLQKYPPINTDFLIRDLLSYTHPHTRYKYIILNLSSSSLENDNVGSFNFPFKATMHYYNL